MRFRLLALVIALAIGAAGLLVLSRDGGIEDVTADSTIGVNALPMSSAPATYRLRLDGTASGAGATPDTSGPEIKDSPRGRHRAEIGNPGVAVIDARTGERRVLSESAYPGAAFWSRDGALAYADRKGGLTRVVTFDPARGRRRVVASHVCGDAFHVDPWSPDGGSLALPVSPPCGGCNGHGGSQAAVWDGSGLRRVAPPGSRPVTWNRDGSRLLVTILDGPSLLVDPRTGKGRKVLAFLSPVGQGAWSPGRRSFAVPALDRARRRQVIILVDGTLRAVVRSLFAGSQFAWSSRAQLLAVAGGRQIWVIDARTGRNAAVIPAHTPYGLVVQSLSWSRDGRSLAVVAAPHLGHD